MNDLNKKIFSVKKESSVSSGKERRREPRVRVDRLVYVQPAEAETGYFEEVRNMRDLSRSGFYFTTERVSYQPGARLYVVPAFGGLNLEYLGEVVRVEKMDSGEFGVAVRLLRVESIAVNRRSNTLTAFEAFSRAESVPAVLDDCEPVGSS